MTGLHRSVTVARRVNASADRMWAVISMPGYLKACHPFCASNEVQRWPGVGSTDTIAYYGGRVVHRHYVAWDEGTGYDLLVKTAAGAHQARCGGGSVPTALIDRDSS